MTRVLAMPDHCTCGALRQATRHLTRAYDRALAPVGLGLNQYAILVRLERLGPVRLQALADNLVMDRSTLGHLLRPLERRGLVTIGAGVDDRRVRAIALSREGRALLRLAKPLWAAVETRFGALFGDRDGIALRQFLAKVTAADLAIAKS